MQHEIGPGVLTPRGLVITIIKIIRTVVVLTGLFFLCVNVNIKMIKKWKIKMYIFQDLFLSLCFHKGSFFF